MLSFSGAVMWNMNLVFILHLPVMMIWWSFAKLQYLEHVKTCHYHSHCDHKLSDKCSLCSRERLRISSLNTDRQESTLTLMMALLKQTLKCAQIIIPLLLLLLLSGDVETNPGPGKISYIQA